MEKLFIKNRKKQNISVVVREAKPPKGLAFIMHGLGGFKEQPQIQTFGEAFFKKGFTVVYFDTTNTLGESDGKTEDATTTNYYEDLEDVIGWGKTREWYQEPFALAGHSLGGMCVALYAEKNPALVSALAPISTAVSGKLSAETYRKYHAKEFNNWEKTGIRVNPSTSRPGAIKRLSWAFIIDAMRYDLLLEARKLTMPVLLMVGENDTSTPLENVRKFYDVIPGPKALHIIKNAKHNFREEEHLDEISTIFSAWLDKLDI